MPKKILIVDDSEMTRRLISTAIRGLGDIEYEEAKDGFEAGDKFSEFKPDMVFLDIKMPGIDGIEVCRKIKSAPDGKNTKVIMVTGFGTESLKRKSFEAGASEFINKPVSLKIVKKIINRFMDK